MLAREVARIDRAGAERVDEVIRSGEIPRYLGPTFLPALVTRWPHLLLDSRFLVAAWSEVSPELRDEILRQVSSAIDDLLWIRDPGGICEGERGVAEPLSARRWQCQITRGMESLACPTSWESSDSATALGRRSSVAYSACWCMRAFATCGWSVAPAMEGQT